MYRVDHPVLSGPNSCRVVASSVTSSAHVKYLDKEAPGILKQCQLKFLRFYGEKIETSLWNQMYEKSV